MKTTRTAIAGMIIALALPLLTVGCAEHKEMKTMDSGMETMHKDMMGSMDKGMGEMEKPGMDKDMPMNEKKDM